ncbi:signal peptidase II [Salinisphaera sp. Q1T1-3]|uniref:signal peptidase II n=1 Tax=Salinisphaera sp. Q1T1-3 TaxID=2321229 RepID=UPI000E723F31|nr:signal peptidase II [Salinisphaera sp. Q1T1-3]RJS95353.1 signal peptidase II [Salinisphaera sp. Q1T1-3]
MTEQVSENRTTRRTTTWQNVHWLWLSVLVIAADQFTKQLVVNHYALYDSTPLTSWLNLTLVHNTGAAFSMLHGATPWLFVALGVAVTLGITIWMVRNPYDKRLFAGALALIAGGALGNVVDRALRGFVVDFVDFHIGAWHYPAFNLADSAIVVGAVLIFVDMLFVSGSRGSNKETDPTSK